MPGGVQGLDRYKYTVNNPINYVDPSGHKECVTGTDRAGSCLDPAGLAYVLLKDYGFIVDDSFSDKDKLKILLEARKIEKYVDTLTGDNGQCWMDKNLSGTVFEPWDGHSGDAQAMPGWYFLQPGANRVQLGSRFAVEQAVHELGHVWDMNTGVTGLQGIVGGVADALNTFIGGNVADPGFDCRYCQTKDEQTGEYILDPNIPDSMVIGNIEVNTWFVGNSYANGSTADYLAETFMYNVYGKPGVPMPASAFVNSMIISQAASCSGEVPQ